MVSAIHLYHKTVMTGDEISNVISYYVLPKKVNPKSFASQMFPKIPFC